jgi:(2R)-ethylmalonyl-CoA mutase
LVEEVLRRMTVEGLGEVPVVVGGIIPPEDSERLRAAGVAGVYTPKDYDLTEILADVVRIIEAAGQKAA